MINYRNIPSDDELEDFYYDDRGRFVMTAHYLLKRGYCCGNGCKHCPFDYKMVPEPGRSKLLEKRKAEQKEDDNYGYEPPKA